MADAGRAGAKTYSEIWAQGQVTTTGLLERLWHMAARDCPSLQGCCGLAVTGPYLAQHHTANGGLPL